MVIRKAMNNDYKWFVNVHKSAWLFHQKEVEWRYQTVEKYSIPLDDYMVLFDKYTVLVAEFDWKIVWTILFSINSEFSNGLFKERNYMYISNFAVLPEYSSKWIWQALMNKAESIAEEKWLKEIQLDVREFNKRAEKFYEKRWFSVSSLNMIKHL